MIGIHVTSNAAKIATRLGGKVDKINRHMEIAFKKGAKIVEREVKLSITDVRAVRTGRMRSSVDGGTIFKPFAAEIAPTVSYATFVDQGTRFIRPRHFMKKGADKARGAVQQAFSEEVRKALSK